MSSASVSAATPATSNESKDISMDFDPTLTEDERRFYLKAYSGVDLVRERKVHCTVCKVHIGTAPCQESFIKMHPVLRVTHCNKCHDFYNSGEFSKGEDGSELYCRWCGQGGEVYCCSNCPFVFCKSCIVKNLSRGVVADIEQNENWSCFSCAPKILWPLRAQHWALMKYIDKQKKEIEGKTLTETERNQQMAFDRSICCRLAKAKCGNMSDSLESLDSTASRKSYGSANSLKKAHKLPLAPGQSPVPKRSKTSNDEVVCTPDLISMLEPDCQITLSPKQRLAQPTTATSPKIMSIQGSYGSQQLIPKGSAPPPLVLRNTSVQMRPVISSPFVRRTIIGPRTPSPGGGSTPVYHTINGYRIDLNSAAQQETFRLPNGKLIQVKRQGSNPNSTQSNSWQPRNIAAVQQQQPTGRPLQITQSTFQTIAQQPSTTGTALSHPQMLRYQNSIVGSTTVAPIVTNSSAQIQVINGTPTPTAPVPVAATTTRPLMIRHVFPDTAIGQARTQLQDQVFNAMEICQHLTGKVQTLTNSNAYKQARNYLEVKELYIHLSYLLTYAIGRFKGLQDKCLADMRLLGFVSDADSLENGQLAADKQASDDEDNEIEIVEPETDTITLDSDTEVDVPSKAQPPQPVAEATAVPPQDGAKTVNISTDSETSKKDDVDFFSAAQTFLASMLEVDLSENEQTSAQISPEGSSDVVHKKQPRKKTTHKPNPTLLKQKEMLERERLEELKRSDLKLKMKCAIELKKAEEEYPFAKQMLIEKDAVKNQKASDENLNVADNLDKTEQAEGGNLHMESVESGECVESLDSSLVKDKLMEETDKPIEEKAVVEINKTDENNSIVDIKEAAENEKQTSITVEKTMNEADNIEQPVDNENEEKEATTDSANDDKVTLTADDGNTATEKETQEIETLEADKDKLVEVGEVNESTEESRVNRQLDTNEKKTAHEDVSMDCSEADKSDVHCAAETANVETENVEAANVETTSVETASVETENVKIEEDKTKNLQTESVQKENVETENVQKENVETKNVETKIVETENVKTENVHTENVQKENVETENVQKENVETEKDKTKTVEIEKDTTENVELENFKSVGEKSLNIEQTITEQEELKELPVVDIGSKADNPCKSPESNEPLSTAVSTSKPDREILQ